MVASRVAFNSEIMCVNRGSISGSLTSLFSLFSALIRRGFRILRDDSTTSSASPVSSKAESLSFSESVILVSF
jgi:hypothetical protein